MPQSPCLCNGMSPASTSQGCSQDDALRTGLGTEHRQLGCHRPCCGREGPDCTKLKGWPGPGRVSSHTDVCHLPSDADAGWFARGGRTLLGSSNTRDTGESGATHLSTPLNRRQMARTSCWPGSRNKPAGTLENRVPEMRLQGLLRGTPPRAGTPSKCHNWEPAEVGA